MSEENCVCDHSKIFWTFVNGKVLGDPIVYDVLFFGVGLLISAILTSFGFAKPARNVLIFLGIFSFAVDMLLNQVVTNVPVLGALIGASLASGISTLIKSLFVIASVALTLYKVSFAETVPTATTQMNVNQTTFVTASADTKTVRKRGRPKAT